MTTEEILNLNKDRSFVKFDGWVCLLILITCAMLALMAIEKPDFSKPVNDAALLDGAR